MPKHLFAYILVGLSFGISDWYFIQLLMWLVRLSRYNLIVDLLAVGLNWGMWLIPAVLVAVYEARRSGRPGRSATAVIIVWLAALMSYYLYYAFLLGCVGLPQMEHLLVFGPRSERFWLDWLGTLRTLILGQLLSWGVIACVAGATIGWISAVLYLRSRHKQRDTRLT